MSDNSEPSPIEPLTSREREILGLLADGLTNREIADRLYLSHETIKWYNKQLYGKLGVSISWFFRHLESKVGTTF